MVAVEDENTHMDVTTYLVAMRRIVISPRILHASVFMGVVVRPKDGAVLLHVVVGGVDLWLHPALLVGHATCVEILSTCQILVPSEGWKMP